MRIAPLAPKLHLFVCANRRAAESPLGSGCGDAGDAVFDALKGEVSASGLFSEAWVTRTQCLGICPRDGSTVVAYPSGHVFTEVHANEVRALFEGEWSQARSGEHGG